MKYKLQTIAEKNYGYLCLGCLFIGLLVYFQFLYLGFADDRIYSTVAHTSLSDFLYFMRYHYMYANGRTWIHVFLMVFLRFGIYPWRVFMPACFTAIVYLIARLIRASVQTMQRTLVRTCAAFLCVNAVVYQDTLFWETGSFNYILPALVLGLLLLALREEKCLWCTPILGFLCGSSMEQFGMITFACLLLWLGYRILRQKDHANRGWFIASVLTTLAGLLTLVLSPSVRARTYAQVGSLADKISYLIFHFWFHSKEMCVFLAFLALAACLYLYSSAAKRLGKAAALLLAAGIAVSGVVGFLPVGTFGTLCTFGFAAAILAAVFWAAVRAFRGGHGIPLLALLLGGGAQVMMLATQRISMRTTMPSVFCFAAFALALLEYTDFCPKALRIASVVCVLLIAAYNVTGYASIAAAQKEELRAGERTANHAVPHQNRSDIDAIIEECETVRLEQVERLKQAAEADADAS